MNFLAEMKDPQHCSLLHYPDCQKGCARSGEPRHSPDLCQEFRRYQTKGTENNGEFDDSVHGMQVRYFKGIQQVLFVRYGILEALHKVIKTTAYSAQPTAAHMLAAALGCLRNLSILKANELSILNEDFLPDMCSILCCGHNWEAQRHAAGTIRNLAVGDHIQAVLESECLEALSTCLLDVRTKPSAHADITAALAVLADEDAVKCKLLSLWNGRMFGRLVSLASLSTIKEVQYNSAGIVGQLTLLGIPDDQREANKLGIVLYIDKFLKSKDPNFLHIGLWTLSQLLKDPEFVTAFKEHHIDHVIWRLLTANHIPAIKDLAQAVQDSLLGVQQEHLSLTP